MSCLHAFPTFLSKFEPSQFKVSYCVIFLTRLSDSRAHFLYFIFLFPVNIHGSRTEEENSKPALDIKEKYFCCEIFFINIVYLCCCIEGSYSRKSNSLKNNIILQQEMYFFPKKNSLYFSVIKLFSNHIQNHIHKVRKSNKIIFY